VVYNFSRPQLILHPSFAHAHDDVSLTIIAGAKDIRMETERKIYAKSFKSFLFSVAAAIAQKRNYLNDATLCKKSFLSIN
jgi:hypothetical protein